MQPGTLRVLEPDDDKHLIVSPVEGMVVRFGRNRPEVHICIGPEDLGVSRLHGTLEYRTGCWWVRATGGRPVRLGHTHELWNGDDPVPLADGRTSLQVDGTNPNEVHLLRVEVAAGHGGCVLPLPPSTRCGTRTAQQAGRPYRLESDERLVLTVVAQRRLRREPDTTLLTCREAVEELEVLRSRKPHLEGTPPRPWTVKMVEHRIGNVRERLAKMDVKNLKPLPGEAAKHDDYYRRNLVEELIRSRTLTPDDLRLLRIDDNDDNDDNDDDNGAAGALVG
jgi:hypothetical protein